MGHEDEAGGQAGNVSPDKNMNERINFDQAPSVGHAEMKATSVLAFHEHLIWGRAVLVVRRGAEQAQAQNL